MPNCRETFGLFVASFLAAGPAHAGNMDSLRLATALGSLIASEKLCDVTYDQKAIEAFVEQKVSAADMDFASTLNMMIEGNRVNYESMSGSQKTAHCTQILRAAKHYGFTN